MNKTFRKLSFLGLLFTTIAFVGCKNDEDSNDDPTPSPTAIPTPTPTPDQLGDVDFNGEAFVTPENTPVQ